jgi:hypothetical protein
MIDTLTLDPVTAAHEVVDSYLADLWEQLFLDCMGRLALPPYYYDQVADHRSQVKNWTEKQLSQFLRDTEATVWTANGDDLAANGKLWVARFIAAQVELGQRLGSWPPVLETLEFAQ